MDRNESNDLTGSSVMLPLPTIEEDIDEIDTITDDNENHLLECNFMTITTNDGKRFYMIVLSKNERLVFSRVYIEKIVQSVIHRTSGNYP